MKTKPCTHPARVVAPRALSVLVSLAVAMALVPGEALEAFGSEVESAATEAARAAQGAGIVASAGLGLLSSSTVAASGTSGTVTWTLYDDGELNLAPTSGNTGTLEDFATLSDPPWYGYRTSIKTVTVTGTVCAGGSLDSMFWGCTNMTSADLTGLDTSAATDMSLMFYMCSSLVSLDLSGFDTSNVTDMEGMFRACEALVGVDVTGFDTAQVEDMSYMFHWCLALTSVDVTGFDTSSVTDMQYMFYACSELTSLDLSGFDTSLVTDMNTMFCACSSLTSLDLSGFDTSSVTSMFQMFNGCMALTSLDLSSFDTAKVKTMQTMFYNCSALTSLDVSGFDLSCTNSTASMFYGCSSLTSLSLSSFDVSSVTKMANMFNGCSALTTIYASCNWDENAPSSSNMFAGCTSLVGGNGTAYDSSCVDCAYAVIDTASTPGYFTDAAASSADEDAAADFSSTLYRAAYLLDDSRGASLSVATDISLILDGTSPAQKLLASAMENDLDTWSSRWDAVTTICDSVDNVSSVYDALSEPKSIYEALIVGILEDSTSDNISISSTAKDALSLSKDLLSKASEQLEGQVALTEDTLLSSSLTQSQINVMADELESLIDDSSAVSATVDVLSAVSNGFKVVSTYGELEEYVGTCIVLANTSEAVATVLQQAYEASLTGDDAYLTAALRDCVEVMDDSQAELFARIGAGSLVIVGETAAQSAVGKLWEGAWTALEAACPGVGVIRAAYKASKFVTNLLLNTDDISEAYAKLDALDSIEGLLGSTYEQLRDEAAADGESEAVAAMYLASIDLMFMTMDEDCVQAAALVDAVDDALVSKFAQFFGADDSSDLKSQIANIQESCYDVWQNAALSMWVLALEEDYPQLYEEYSSVLSEARERVLTKEYISACPVDVYVYDSSGTLVARCVDGMASCEGDAALTLIVEDDAKTVQFFDDNAYTISYVGTDVGAMDVTMTEYDDDGVSARTVNYNAVALAAGSTYTADVSSDALSSNTCTLVDADSGEVVEADYDSLADDGTAYAVEVVNGYATVAGEPFISGSAAAGQTVELSACVPEGYAFVRWESAGDVEVSFADAQSASTTFAMPQGEVQVTAVYARDLAYAEVELSKTSYTYNGKARTPAVTVTIDGQTLSAGTHYTLSYADNKNVGTATVTVSAVDGGGYAGAATATFTIKRQGLTGAHVKLSATSFVYNGKQRTPTVTVKVGSTTLKKGTDYTLSWSKSTRKAIGTYKVTVKGKGTYTGSVTKTFKIKPAKTTLKSVKAGASGSSKLTVKWATTAAGKKSGAKYQIAYKKKGAAKWSYKIVSAKTYTKALTKLAKGKKYTVKVRAYKKVSGKTYYGAWSKTKTVKVK